jgi:ABC-type uncharacterized transport system substrate-binding protein
LTGINFLSGELAAKRLELLRELVPGAARVAVLVNPANATSTESSLRDVTSVARTAGLQINVLNASTGPEIEAAFGGVALIFVLVYYLLRSLRWLGSIIAAWAEVSLPTPIFNICRWAVRGIAATWHVLILLVFALTLGRRLFG